MACRPAARRRADPADRAPRRRRPLGPRHRPTPATTAGSAPGSTIWAVHADAATLVGGVRALLVQAMHPTVLAGFDQHSAYREDPESRLQRTAAFVTVTTFGTSAQAEQACARVRRAHAPVRGRDPRGRDLRRRRPRPARLGPPGPGRLARRVGPPATGRPRFDLDSYLADMAVVGEHLGAAHVPHDRAGLAAAWDHYLPQLAVHRARRGPRVPARPAAAAADPRALPGGRRGGGRDPAARPPPAAGRHAAAAGPGRPGGRPGGHPAAGRVLGPSPAAAAAHRRTDAPLPRAMHRCRGVVAPVHDTPRCAPRRSGERGPPGPDGHRHGGRDQHGGRVPASSHQSRAASAAAGRSCAGRRSAPKPRASIAVASRTPRRTAATSTANTCAANTRRCRHRRPAGVEAAGPAGPADHAASRPPAAAAAAARPARRRRTGPAACHRCTSASARSIGSVVASTRMPGSAIASSRSDTATAASTPSRGHVERPELDQHVAAVDDDQVGDRDAGRRRPAAARYAGAAARQPHPGERHQPRARAASSSAGVTGSSVSSSADHAR